MTTVIANATRDAATFESEADRLSPRNPVLAAHYRAAADRRRAVVARLFAQPFSGPVSASQADSNQCAPSKLPAGP